MAAKTRITQLSQQKSTLSFSTASSSVSRSLTQQRASMANLANFKIPEVKNEVNVSTSKPENVEEC